MVEALRAPVASPNVLADLLASTSEELLQTVACQFDGESGAERPAAQTSGTAIVLQRLLAAQREATQLCRNPQDANGAGFVDAVLQRQEILNDFMARLESAASGMAASIERNTPNTVPDRCAAPPSIESVERTLALAHRLSYTSFAPVGFQPGVTPLGNHRPPAPQPQQMAAAQLHQFAAEHEQAALQRKGQLPTAMAEQPATPAAAGVTPALLANIPRMPAGWKPGDPLPGMEPAVPSSTQPAAAAAAPPTESVPTPPSLPSEPPKPQRPVLDASFLVLNPDLEEAIEEDYSSDEEFSDSD